MSRDCVPADVSPSHQQMYENFLCRVELCKVASKTKMRLKIAGLKDELVDELVDDAYENLLGEVTVFVGEFSRARVSSQDRTRDLGRGGNVDTAPSSSSNVRDCSREGTAPSPPPLSPIVVGDDTPGDKVHSDYASLDNAHPSANTYSPSPGPRNPMPAVANARSYTSANTRSLVIIRPRANSHSLDDARPLSNAHPRRRRFLSADAHSGASVNALSLDDARSLSNAHSPSPDLKNPMPVVANSHSGTSANAHSMENARPLANAHSRIRNIFADAYPHLDSARLLANAQLVANVFSNAAVHSDIVVKGISVANSVKPSMLPNDDDIIIIDSDSSDGDDSALADARENVRDNVLPNARPNAHDDAQEKVRANAQQNGDSITVSEAASGSVGGGGAASELIMRIINQHNQQQASASASQSVIGDIVHSPEEVTQRRRLIVDSFKNVAIPTVGSITNVPNSARESAQEKASTALTTTIHRVSKNRVQVWQVPREQRPKMDQQLANSSMEQQQQQLASPLENIRLYWANRIAQPNNTQTKNVLLHQPTASTSLLPSPTTINHNPQQKRQCPPSSLKHSAPAPAIEPVVKRQKLNSIIRLTSGPRATRGARNLGNSLIGSKSAYHTAGTSRAGISRVGSSRVGTPRAGNSNAGNSSPGPSRSGSTSHKVKKVKKPGQAELNKDRIKVKWIRCMICRRIVMFSSRDELHVHLKRKHRVNPIRCPLIECGERFERMPQLGSHVARRHQGTNTWPCSKCPPPVPVFESCRALNSHIRYIHDEGIFGCPLACDFEATKPQLVSDHYYSVHRAGGGGGQVDQSVPGEDASVVPDGVPTVPDEVPMAPCEVPMAPCELPMAPCEVPTVSWDDPSVPYDDPNVPVDLSMAPDVEPTFPCADPSVPVDLSMASGDVDQAFQWEEVWPVLGEDVLKLLDDQLPLVPGEAPTVPEEPLSQQSEPVIQTQALSPPVASIQSQPTLADDGHVLRTNNDSVDLQPVSKCPWHGCSFISSDYVTTARHVQVRHLNLAFDWTKKEEQDEVSTVRRVQSEEIPKNLMVAAKIPVVGPMSSIVRPMSSIVGPKNSMMKPMKLMMGPMNSLMGPMNLMVGPKNSIVEPMNLMVRPKNSMVGPKNLVVEQKKTAVIKEQVMQESNNNQIVKNTIWRPFK